MKDRFANNVRKNKRHAGKNVYSAAALACTLAVMIFVMQPAFAAASFAMQEDTAPAVDLSDVNEETAVTDELLVLAEEGTTKRQMSDMADDAGGSLEKISTLNDGSRLASVRLDDPGDMQDAADSLIKEDKILIVQPNYLYTLDETETESVPDDTYASSQWYIYPTSKYSGGIDATDAWDQLSSDASDVTVAVIDTGAQLDHPDLGNVLSDKCVTYNNGTKYSFSYGDDSDDDSGHGTHVCGIISATAENSEGIAGVSYNKAKIIVIDAALPSSLGFTTQDIVLSISYAVDQGAKLINMSLGGLYRDYIMEAAVDSAFDNGTLCICAAGNETSLLYCSPGDAAGAVSVMSHTKTGNKSSFSNYGTEKDVSAPGSSIRSTYPSSTYKDLNGTSMATPVVTGIAALLLAEDSSLSARELKNYLYTSSGSGTYTDGTSGEGFGRVNAYNAVCNVKKSAASPKSIVLNRSDITMYVGEEKGLEYAVYPAAASSYADSVTFTSSDTSVATVDKNGLITAVGAGTANITASVSGVSTTCSVTVSGITYESFSELPFTKEGTLSPDDPALHVTDGSYSFESYLDGFETELSKDEKISITLESSTFRPYIRILDSSDNLKSYKRYSGSSSSSMTLSTSYTADSAGTYRIQVMGYPTGDETTDKPYTFTVTHTHKLSAVAAADATCTEAGNEAYYKCSLCGAMFSDSAGKTQLSEVPAIAALGHSYESVVTEPTCTEKGYTTHTCSRCGDSYTGDETEAKGHTAAEAVKENEAAATCDKKGSYDEVVYCSVCGEELSRETKTTDALGHDYGEPAYEWSDDHSTCTATMVCKNDSSHKVTETVESTSETTTATCETAGSTVYTAAFENEKFETQTYTAEIAATGHKLTATAAKAATCTAAGNSAYWTCDTCGKYFSDEDGETEIEKDSWALAALGHDYGDPTYEWSDDHKTCTATMTCKNYATHVVTETAESTSETTAATCEAAGSTVYTAAFENSSFETQTYTAKLAATGHKLKATAAKAATCTAAGNSAYWTCETCGKYFSDEDGKTEIEEDSWVIDALGHDYGDPTYEWSDDHKTCTATMTCKNYATHVVTETAESTSETTAATCEAAGSTVYTAAFENEKFETQTYTAEIAATSHKLTATAAKAATCTAAGNSAYWTCDTCGKYFSDEDGETEIEKDSWALAALGHSYAFAGWEWTGSDEEGYTAATAAFACAREGCSHTESAVAEVTSETTESSCQAEGLVTYTATAEFDDVTYTDKKTVGIDKKAHNWSDAEYTWSGMTCTASRHCTNDGCDAEDTETVTATLTDSKDATCTEAGYEIYTASFTGDAFEDQTYEIQRETTDHSWDGGEVTKKPTCTEKGVMTYTCTVCGETRTEDIPELDSESGSGGSSADSTSQTGTDGTAFGKGASAEAAEAAIAALTSDKDPAGTVYSVLRLRSTKQGKNNIKLKWNAASGAVKYVIYGNRCGKANKMQKLATTAARSYNVKSAGSKLKKGKYYKFIVVALDSNNNVVSTSKVIHVATKGGKVKNPTKVTVKKTKASIKTGKKYKMGAKQYGSRVKKHRALKYESSNRAVATVTSKGKVKAIGKGTCYIYAYAQNGIYKRTKITVK